MSETFLYLGGFLPIIWGIAHLFPTKSVVEGFGDISQDNKQIITMEWLVEGIALIFVGVLVVTITLINPRSIIATTTYIMASIFLFAIAIVSLFTGFKINFLPYKLCPVIFTTSAVLISLGVIAIS